MTIYIYIYIYMVQAVVNEGGIDLTCAQCLGLRRFMFSGPQGASLGVTLQTLNPRCHVIWYQFALSFPLPVHNLCISLNNRYEIFVYPFITLMCNPYMLVWEGGLGQTRNP